MTREEWARSLPDPIRPAQIVERISAALNDVGQAATDILTSKRVDMPLSLASAQRDAMKLRDGAQQFAQFQPDTAWSLSSNEGQAGMRIGLALFDGLDDLRRMAMKAPPAEGIVNPVDVAKKAAAAAQAAANAVPTVAIILGLLWLAHKFGDE